MPLYSVHHIFDLSMEQKDKLAVGLTKIHAELFTTPKLFVNVEFVDDVGKHTYVAGKRKSGNKIIATVRHGPSRTSEMYNSLCKQINDLWTEVVPGAKENPVHDLRTIFIAGALVGGIEEGFYIPAAGEDEQWLKRNMADFKQKADAGDEVFIDLLHDIKSRQGLSGMVGDWKSQDDIIAEKEKKKEEEKEKAEGGQ